MEKANATTEEQRKRRAVKNQTNYMHNLKVKAAHGDKKLRRK